jgi:hypothetical protein
MFSRKAYSEKEGKFAWDENVEQVQLQPILIKDQLKKIIEENFHTYHNYGSLYF